MLSLDGIWEVSISLLCFRVGSLWCFKVGKNGKKHTTYRELIAGEPPSSNFHPTDFFASRPPKPTIETIEIIGPFSASTFGFCKRPGAGGKLLGLQPGWSNWCLSATSSEAPWASTGKSQA